MRIFSRRSAIASIAFLSAAALVAPTTSSASTFVQAEITGVNAYPAAPQPAFGNFSWINRAQAFDDFAYDWTDRGIYTTIRTDSTALNMPGGKPTYKMPAYYGDQRVQTAGPNNGDGYQESVTQLASVISATLIGIDKSNQTCGMPTAVNGKCNYVDMLQTFYRGSTTGVAGNTPTPGGSGVPGTNDGWYQFLPNALYSILGEMYPEAENMTTIQRNIGDKFYDAVVNLGGANANFDMWDYNFATGQKYLNGTKYQSAELATVVAFVLINAYEKFGDQKYLTGAKWAMDSIERSNDNTYYEITVLLTPYIAARMNALYGTNYDVTKPLRWLMEGSKVRNNWGTLGALATTPVKWAGKDVSGLQGSLSDRGPSGDGEPGYVFAMNSFASPWFAATAKYDTSYANLVGKWLLNVNSAARLFFADQLSASQQYYGSDFIDGVSAGQSGSATGWDKDDRASAIAYEALQSKANDGIRALSDVPERSTNWGVGSAARGLGMYGSAWIGFMSVIHPTNVDNVLRIDLNALDTYGEKTYPTSLIYNPTGSVQQIQVPLASGAKDLYDSVSGTFLARGVSGNATIPVPAGNSVVVVELPAGATLTHSGSTLLANGAAMAYDVADLGDVARDKSATYETADPATSVPVAPVVDGDATTGFASTQAVARSVTVDTGTVRELGRVALNWGAKHPSSYTLSASVDGTSWSTVGSPITSLGGIEDITFAPVNARYVRVNVAAGAGEFTLRSFEVSIADLARSKPANASSTQPGKAHDAFQLTDGSSGTRWESRTQDYNDTEKNNQNVVIDLGKKMPLGGVRLNWEGAFGKTYTFDVSDNGTAWTTVGTESNNTAAGIKNYTLNPGASGRYLRWSGTARGTTYAYSLWDFQVFGAPGLTRTGQAYTDVESVSPGDDIALTGAGYQPGEQIQITIDGIVVKTINADPSGAFATSVSAPNTTGPATIVATGTASGSSTQFVVTVEVADATTTSLALNGTKIVADSTDSVVATVNVASAGSTTPEGTVVLTGGAREIGRATVVNGVAQITMGSDLPIGSYNLVASFESANASKWTDSASMARQLDVAIASVTIKASVLNVRVGVQPVLDLTVTTPGKWEPTNVWIARAGGGQFVTVPASGKVKVKLPYASVTGTQKVTVTVPAAQRRAAKSASVTYSVAKAAPKIKVAAKKKVRKGQALKLTIKITAPARTGTKAAKAKIFVGSKRVATVSVKKSGKASVKIRISKTGTKKVQVKFPGNKTLKAVKKTVKVRVIR
ncbi:hypothetical protein GCM10010401_01370 [Rarobacter faecitabidus]|uniref:Ig-like domain-containing protein n=1 Tax=Rarobacter faecitabidus TaxID=13243 RepID=A0A542ZWK6_RARFA|nr:discoidin domain-containing protein [Rarobacter faecitabidus]TQL64727.1 Ig-like domain-containing protein [Rarobacter faecitabidus]